MKHQIDKPIRVLHMIGRLGIGGTQALVVNLYNNIDHSKVQFDFIVDHPEENVLNSSVEKFGAKIYVMPQFKGTNLIEILQAWNIFFKQHKEYKILHSHVRGYASLYLPIAKKYGVKTIIHSHSTSNGKGMQAAIKKIMQYPLRYQADYLFACSNKAGIWLFGKTSLKRKNFFIFPNAIDGERFIYNKEKRIKIREELQVEDKFVIGNIGRLTTPKNHIFLLRIFAELIKEKDDATLIIIGDGELRNLLEKECAKLGIQEQVKMIGSKSNVEDYYMAMDVFVFPSLWEGLGISVIEAQATGLPCIISDQIPIEAIINTDLVEILKLSDSVEKWVNTIMNTKGKKRLDQIESVKNAGYDIKVSASKLQNFYIKCIMENENGE